MNIVALIGGIIGLIGILALFAFGLSYIVKHEGKIKLWQENLILIIISLFYFLNLFEKVFVIEIKEKTLTNNVPLGNISPTLFTLCFIFLFVPRKYRNVFYSLVGMMMPAMFFASMYNSIGYLINPLHLYICSMFDVLGHAIFALFGFYIIRNGIVKFDKKSNIISCSVIYGFVVLYIVLNLIFNTSFYGLNFYGKHNIYNLVLTDNPFLSAFIYILGLTLLILLGIFVARLLLKKFQSLEENEV